jgi:hypothetical protein
MHRHHRLEILQLHLAEALVAQDAGIGDQDVDAAERVHGLLDQIGHTGVIGDRAAIGDGFAAGGLDLGHHFFRRFGIAAAAVQRSTQIVDHNLGAAPRQLQRMTAAQSAASPGDDGDLACE